MALFESFPSLTRFSQGWSITEKIDGTNAQVYITHYDAEPDDDQHRRELDMLSLGEKDGYRIFAGSRTRMITTSNDNHGFAGWVKNNSDMLIDTLGPGRHFGEWWGRGIQRGYGLNEKRFSLFNSLRWKQEDLPEGLYVVPCIVNNEYLDNPGEAAQEALNGLKIMGSHAAPGFMNPEGIVMFHRASGVAFKKTFDYDEYGKWIEKQSNKENIL